MKDGKIYPFPLFPIQIVKDMYPGDPHTTYMDANTRK